MAIFPRVIKFERFTIHSILNKKWRHLHLNLIIPFPSLSLQLFLKKKRKRNSEEQIRKKKKEINRAKNGGSEKSPGENGQRTQVSYLVKLNTGAKITHSFIIKFKI